MSTLPQSTDNLTHHFLMEKRPHPQDRALGFPFSLLLRVGAGLVFHLLFKKKMYHQASLFDPLMFLCNPAFCSGVLLLLLNEVCTAEFGK